MSKFFQEPPVLANQFTTDALLRHYLHRACPASLLPHLTPELERFGERVTQDILHMGLNAEAQEPQLTQFSPWGKRIDQIVLAPGWQQLDAVSAQEGLVALGYERPYGAFSRVYQFIKLYLFTASSAIYTCPLAMTDGAARVLEKYRETPLQEEAFRHLTTRDPHQFWTSGQWMTERPGGSDVGQSETLARWDGKGYRLYGDKWFTSAVTSQMALTLARIEDEQGQSLPGSRGLSLFYLETHRGDGALNDILVHRLKDKLGTRALPTAELTLNGTRAERIGLPGHGVRQMATMLNITRLYNSVSAISFMRRGLALARDYAYRRSAFGKKLAEHALHQETLATLELEFSGSFLLVFYVVELLGKDECGIATPAESALLRLLTPVVKLYTGKQGVAVTSEILECFGGAGYVEDTGLPKLLRDAQVLAIWEGTTNVLSLDTLRALGQEGLEPFIQEIEQRLSRLSNPEFAGSIHHLKSGLQALQDYAAAFPTQSADWTQLGARGFAFSLARLMIGALLLEQAQWDLAAGKRRALALARRWCAQELTPLVRLTKSYAEDTRVIALGE